MKSNAARLIAVRQAREQIRQEALAGTDDALRPGQQPTVVAQIHPRRWQCRPARPRERRRSRSVPVHERAQQTLVSMALEPEWAVRFASGKHREGSGHSCPDALGAIRAAMYTGEQYVLCADLQECLATLKPQALLRKLQTLPAVGRLIKAWLAAGVMDCCPPARTALVPLLVNVALHDLETRLLQACGEEQGDARVVHAAGVLVVLHPALAGVHRARLLTQIWLQELGLTWQPGNLKIAHTLKPYRGNIGFDFLGWAVRHYPTGKKRVGRGAKDLSPGCVTIIRAGREHTWQHMAEIKRVLNEHRAASQETLIRQLNPLIEKWAASCRATGATQDLAACDHQLWWLLWRWARRRHANKGQAWIRDRYWYRAETRRWIFGCRRGPTLRLYTQARGQFRPQESPACSASEHLPLFAARESQCLCTVRQPIQQIRSLYRREQDWCHSQVTIH